MANVYLFSIGYLNDQGNFSYLSSIALNPEESTDNNTAIDVAGTILANITGELHIRKDSGDFEHVTTFVPSEVTSQETE